VTPKDPSSPGKDGKDISIKETLQVDVGVEIADKEFEIPEQK